MIATIIILVVMTLSLGVSIGEHGRERPTHNAWIVLLSVIITLILYYYAGLFNNFN